MAKGTGKYAGIEIQFTAEYSDLVKALREIDVKSRQLNNDLKAIDKAMEFDPGNIELAAARQKVLSDAIAKTAERLKQLQSTEDEVRRQYDEGKIPADQYARYQTELTKTEKALEALKAQQTGEGEQIVILRDKLREAEEALKNFQQAAKSGNTANVDLGGAADLDSAISVASSKIEGYQSRLKELIAREAELRAEQTGLKSSTKELSDAQDKAVSSAQNLTGQYSATKAVIADLASTAIKKTARALVDFAKDSVDAASSLYEVENVVDVAFEDMRGKVDEFSATAIESYGISELTAKRTASLFAAMAKGMDITLDKATDMAIGLSERSADMASFYDISQDITSTALKSVFTGETESLKRFGVVMTEANIQQYAFSQGIEKSVKDMTQAEKVQLRYNYLMQATSASAGDFARTSDSFANKTRQMKERITETSVTIGNKLITNLDGVFTTVDKLLKRVDEAAENGELDDIIRDTTTTLKVLLNTLSLISSVLIKFPKLTTTAAAGFTVMSKVHSHLDKATIAANALSKATGKTVEESSKFVALNSKLTGGVTAWAGIATAAISAGMAIKGYIDSLDEEVKARNKLSDELQAEVDAAKELNSTYQEDRQGRLDNIAAIEGEYQAYKDRAKELVELSQKSEKTSEDLSKMRSITDNLNGSMQGLGLSFDGTTGSINMQGEELTELIGSYEDLAKAEGAKNALKDTYEDQAVAQAKVNAAAEKRIELLDKIEKANSAIDKYEKAREEWVENGSSIEAAGELDILRQEAEEAESALKGFNEAMNVTNQKYVEYIEMLDLSNEELKYLNELYDEASEGSEEAKERLEEETARLAEQAKTLEELQKAYTDADNALSAYKSEISDLISTQKDLNEGTEMSTIQMLDMVEKYPELIDKIKESENGYTLEKNAIEELIQVRIRNMKLAAQEAADAQRQTLQTKGLTSGMISEIERAYNEGYIKDIASFTAGAYTDEVRDYLYAYAKNKNIGSVTNEILKNGFKAGSAASEKTAKETADTTEEILDKSADQTERYFKQLEHDYNMGRLTEEQYYNELEKLNNKYYKGKEDMLDKYWSYEEKIYAFRKKAGEQQETQTGDIGEAASVSAEDRLKELEEEAQAYKKLDDNINSVIDAEKKLRGIESNKNVLAYNEATGFRLEANKTDLAAASKTLKEAQQALLMNLADMSGNGGIYEAVTAGLKESTSSALKQILPDLTNAYSAAALSTDNKGGTKNYTFNFGDIKASGSADDLKKLLSEFVNAVIDEE